MQVRVIRSARRIKTVSARLVRSDLLEVRAPAAMSDAELEPIIAELWQRAQRRRGQQQAFRSDQGLQRRAEQLNARYFGGRLQWQSIRYVPNGSRMLGSCTPANGTLRIAERLAHAPQFVLDYVIIHELAHLIEANHSPRFWELVYRFKMAERARGFLMAWGLEGDEDAEQSA
ncbi:MAG: M48 family metallopeptidase [Anaerolineae bacterium]|nr:M48 family metallopeptidase [Chloroflexota bacterium]